MRDLEFGVEKLLTLANQSKHLQNFSLKIQWYFFCITLFFQSFFSHPHEITTDAFDMMISPLTTGYKALKKLSVNVIRYEPLTRAADLGEEEIIQNLTKICQNLVNLESLEISIPR